MHDDPVWVIPVANRHDDIGLQLGDVVVLQLPVMLCSVFTEFADSVHGVLNQFAYGEARVVVVERPAEQVQQAPTPS